jgi:hypothetical protein
MDLLTLGIIAGALYLFSKSREASAETPPSATPLVPPILGGPGQVFGDPPLIDFGPAVNTVPDYSINDINLPSDIPAGSFDQWAGSVQSLIDRGNTQSNVQAYVDSWSTIDRSMEPVLLAVVPEAADPYIYLHKGERIPAGTAYVVTNPTGSVAGIGQITIQLDPAYAQNNPPDSLGIIRSLGILA